MFTYEKKARALQSYEQTQSVWEMSKLIRLISNCHRTSISLLPSARCLPLHTHGPLLFRLLHGLFGAAAAIEEQQIPRVLVKIALHLYVFIKTFCRVYAAI